MTNPGFYRALIIRFLLLCLAALPAAVECQEQIRIGVLTTLTGNWAEVGQNVRRGVSLGVEEINRSGGVLGREIKLDFQDTREEVSGAKVVTSYRFLRSQGVKIFIGPTGVPGEKALAPIAKQEDVLVVSPLTGPQIQNYSDNLFNSAGTNETTTRATARLAFERGARKAAVFGSLQPWEADQAKFFAEEFESLGGEIAVSVAPQPEQRDLKLEALKINRARPDGVFFAVFNQVALAARTLQELGYEGSAYLALIDSAHLVGSNGGLEGAAYYQFQEPSPEFVKKFKSRFSVPPSHPADYAYDAALAIAHAAKLADSLEPKRLKEALYKVKFEGSSGEQMSFDSSGMIQRRITAMMVMGDDFKQPEYSAE